MYVLEFQFFSSSTTWSTAWLPTSTRSPESGSLNLTLVWKAKSWLMVVNARCTMWYTCRFVFLAIQICSSLGIINFRPHRRAALFCGVFAAAAASGTVSLSYRSCGLAARWSFSQTQKKNCKKLKSLKLLQFGCN